MTAKPHLDAGHVRDAQQALSGWLRDHPGGFAERTSLFELLCFSGDYDRAAKQLAMLAAQGPQHELGATLYYAALHAERTRHDLFRDQKFPTGEAPPSPAGRLNGRPFTTLADVDPRLGARLEVFAAGSYVWIPFAHLESVVIEPPRRLRDTLWLPAIVRGRPVNGKSEEAREMLIPAIYPFSWQAEDQNLWLGRMTDWPDGQTPRGQKLLATEDEEFSLLDIRRLEFDHAAP